MKEYVFIVEDAKADTTGEQGSLRDPTGSLEYESGIQGKSEETKVRSRKKSNVVGFLIYSTCIIAVLAAFFGGSSQQGYRTLFGYTAFSVLTDSMQSEIPRSSLVVVKETDANEIAVGDDITYLREDNSTVTHRVISIFEDYQGSGMRGFQTKGIENAIPDPEIVFANNVLGKVVYHSKLIGTTLSAIRGNIIYIILTVMILSGLYFSLRIVFEKDRKKINFSQTDKMYKQEGVR